MRLTLSCHPDFPSDAITEIAVDIDVCAAGNLALHYTVLGAAERLVLPGVTSPERTDGLWNKTCFEAFVAPKDRPEYLEVNLSPSRQWAVYAFDRYREGMSNPVLENLPEIETSTTARNFELLGRVDLSGMPIMEHGSLEIALSAVILEKSGRKSLWALHHASGSPDFHNRDCFIHKLRMAKLR